MNDEIDIAMGVLLSKRQDQFVRSRTFAGPSRKEIVRNLIARGIRDWNREWGCTYDIDPATGEITRHVGELPFPLPIKDLFRLRQAEALRKRQEWWRVSEFLP